MHLGLVIRELREGWGWTQTELAKYSGVHHSSISRWENGERLGIGGKDLLKLARTLGADPYCLLPDLPPLDHPTVEDFLAGSEYVDIELRGTTESLGADRTRYLRLKKALDERPDRFQEKWTPEEVQAYVRAHGPIGRIAEAATTAARRSSDEDDQLATQSGGESPHLTSEPPPPDAPLTRADLEAAVGEIRAAVQLAPSGGPTAQDLADAFAPLVQAIEGFTSRLEAQVSRLHLALAAAGVVDVDTVDDATVEATTGGARGRRTEDRNRPAKDDLQRRMTEAEVQAERDADLAELRRHSAEQQVDARRGRRDPIRGTEAGR